MRFLNEFQAEIKSGVNGIILSGSTRDYFPFENKENGRSDLYSLSDILMKKFEDEFFPIVYSPAFGFQTTEANASELPKVLGLASGESNPIAAAQNSVIDLSSYEPSDAIKFIGGINYENRERKYLVILEDVETFCSKQDEQTGSTCTKSMPVVLSSLINRYHFKGGDNVLVLITNSVSALSGRLSGADSSFKTVIANRPYDDERRSYLEERVIHLGGFSLEEQKAAILKQINEKEEEKQSSGPNKIKKQLSKTILEALDLNSQIGSLDTKITNLNSRLKAGDFYKSIQEGAEVNFYDSSKVLILSLVIDSILNIKNGVCVRFKNTEGKFYNFGVDTVFKIEKNVVLASLYKSDSDNLHWFRAIAFSSFDIKNGIDENAENSEILKQISLLESQKEKKVDSFRKKDAEVKLLEEKVNQIVEGNSKIDNDIEELKNTLRNLESNLEKLAISNCDLETLVRTTKGLSYLNIQQLIKASLYNKEALTEKQILDKRKSYFDSSYGHLFDIVEPLYGFDYIAGLSHIKDYFIQIARLMRECKYADVPMGTTLMGPPGTGKTAIGEAFAKDAGVIFVKMKQTRDSLVGSSERNLEEALNALQTLSPVVVFKDEVDQEDGGRDSYNGDSGVSNRMRQMWMTFLSDPKIRGKVLLISATNRPDLIDPALLRSGRSDERIFVPMPDPEARCELFKIKMKEYGYETNIEDFIPFAEVSEKLSGADIQVVVRRAREFSLGRNLSYIDARALMDALDDFIPSYNEVKNAEMTLLAINYSSSKRFLPKNVEEIRKECQMIIDRHKMHKQLY